MLQNDHNIDKKVRETMSSWEVPPPPGVWARLERSVVDSRRLKMIILRRRVLSVAAVVLAFMTGYFIALNSSFDNSAIPSNGKPSELADNQPQQSVKEHSNPTENVHGSATDVQAYSPATLNKQIPSTGEKPILISKDKSSPLSEVRQALPEVLLSFSNLTQTIITDLYPPEDISADIPDSPVWPGFVSGFRFKDSPVLALTDPAPKNREIQRWSISGMAGQTYANYYQSSYAQNAIGVYEHSLMATTKDQIIRPLTSYTLDINYKITPGVGIGTGLAMCSFSTPMTSPERSEFTLLSTNKTVGNSLGTLELNSNIRDYLMKVPLLEVNSTQFEQRLSYLEIPLTASWNIADKRVGFGVKAGFGGNVLLDNSVYLQSDDYSSEIGTTAEIKDFYISGIIAMDLSFRLHKHWKWNFSPIYRHALQSVSSSNYDPKIISFGLYTGILYRF